MQNLGYFFAVLITENWLENKGKKTLIFEPKIWIKIAIIFPKILVVKIDKKIKKIAKKFLPHFIIIN